MQTPTKSISRTVTVTTVERPARKLVLLRSARAHRFDSFCEEKGCEWLDTLNAIPGKMDTAALLCTWPSGLIAPGTDGGTVAAGVEVPSDYASPLPSGYDIIDLPPCTMLYFEGEPFENEEEWPEAMGIGWSAMDNYDLARHGWLSAPDLAPRFNFGADSKIGQRNAMPVKHANPKPKFSIAFGIKENRREAFEFYREIFGARKVWEDFVDDPEAIHIGMEIYGLHIMLCPPEGTPAGGGMVHFATEAEVRRAYGLLIREGSNYSIQSYPWTPLGATVTDKYGVGWWLSLQ
jgi:uncharacterized glyoxalase superfamily protein PhnB